MGTPTKRKQQIERLPVPELVSLDWVKSLDWPTLKRRWNNFSLRARVAMVVFVVVFVNIMIFIPMPSRAAGTVNFYLFWDPGSGYTLPGDWATVTSIGGTSILGLFPRGEDPAVFNGRGGHSASAITPTFTGTVSAEIGGTNQGNGNQASSAASLAHTHTAPSVTNSPTDTAPSGGDTTNVEFPVYRSLQLIRYTGNPSSDPGGIPTVIPAGAIAMFASTTLPPNFTPYNSNNSKFVQIDSTVNNGGNDSLVNSLTLSSVNVGNSVGTDTTNSFFGTNSTAAGPTHTHSISSTSQTITTASVPPYIQPVLAQATANVATISINMTAMFSADPGSGWLVLSSSGGAYYQKQIRPGATYSAGGGSATRTPSITVSTGGPSATTATFNIIGGNLAPPTHTHNVTYTTSAISNVPQYFNVVIAQKVSFTLNAYRFYVDSSANTVSDPWPTGAAVDIGQTTRLTAVPVAYQPPSTQGAAIRIRIQILVNGNNATVGSTAFKLQYQKTTDSACLNGAWTDVGPASGTGTEWRYGANTAVTDGATLTGTSVFSPASNQLETFSRSSTTATIVTQANTGQTMEFDWLIENYNAASGSAYYFRPIETSGTPLSLYHDPSQNVSDICPEITTKPGVDQVLRHGNFFNGGYEEGFTWAE